MPPVSIQGNPKPDGSYQDGIKATLSYMLIRYLPQPQIVIILVQTVVGYDKCIYSSTALKFVVT